jgi:membrane-anchored protein YejM (alkaline phosphatase superfamily)
MSAPTNPNEPTTRPKSAALRLWVWNVLLAGLLHLRFLRGVEPSGAEATVFLAIGLFTNAFVLSLIPALVSSPFALLLGPWPRLRRTLVGLVWTLFLAALWLDANIWGLFHYHFNGMVWATMTNPAAGDAVHIGTQEIVVTMVGAVLVWWLEALGMRQLERRAPTGFRPSNRVVFLALLLPLTLVEKGLYARADLIRDRRVTAIARVFPVYQRLTVNGLAVKHFGYDLNARPKIDLGGKSILLDYPREAPVFGEPIAATPAGKRPNIAIFVLDSLRADALTPKVMPETSAFAAAHGARIFDDHYSGGNATRFGLFSLLYSLHGSYWIPVSTEETSPVLVDALVDLDYDMGVFSSASMNYPEFRSTAWVRIADDVFDELDGEGPAGRDAEQVAAVDRWLDARDTRRPFFLFSLLDSPHQIYSFPEDEAPFRPYAKSLDYTSLSSGASEAEKLELQNSYKNAVHHADRVVGDILRGLEARGELDNTLVIITGDHGEEFWEHGFFGHTSNFTEEQVHVPFVLAGPGVPAGRESLPTSHLDVVPTLLELLGADPANRPQWSLGENLFAPPGRDRRRIVSGWDLLGLEAPGGILIVPTATHRGLVEGKTHDWKDLIPDGPLIEAEGAALGRLALECGRFLR